MKIAKITETGENLRFDLQQLLTTRCLLSANSGGGKSYLIRKILEETHGKVQHIVIDLEGEFSSLREQYDYILAGVGDKVDVQANLRTAEILAKKVLELNVSIIIDISEMKKHERILFVKKFLSALVEAPKSLWHPVMIIIDEAHNFCSQREKTESTSAVIDLMTRGRKRGFCLHQDTEIITLSGMKKIKDIKKGEKVLTHKGRFREVISTLERDYSGNLIDITSYGHYKSCSTTPGHKYLCHLTKNTTKGSVVQENEIWVKAKELKKLSKRIFSPVITENKDIAQLNVKYWKNQRIRKFKIKNRGYRELLIKLNSPLLKVIGAFLAEGSYIRRQYQKEKKLAGIVFSFGNSKKELNFAKEIKSQLKKLGYHSTISIRKADGRKADGGYILRLRKREISELFMEYFGEYSHNKKIPMNFLLLPKHKLKVLFDYYLKGDGYKIKNNGNCLTTTSKNMAEFMFLAGQKLGYSSSIQKHHREKGIILGRKVNLKNIYRIYFKSSYYTRSKKIDKKLCKSIKSIETKKINGKVYNLQVEEDESYCTLNQVLHNCGILCTQRLSKLHKDAAAEANNRLIGRIGLDIDMKRAGEELGFSSKEDVRNLRNLQPGEFYAFGPALTQAVTKVKVGSVKTTHFDLAHRVNFDYAPPTEKIKSLLAKLADLPQEAEKELREKADYEREVRSLKAKLRMAENSKPKEVTKVVGNEKAVKLAYLSGVREGEQKLKREIAEKQNQIVQMQKAIRDAEKDFNKAIMRKNGSMQSFYSGLKQIIAICSKLIEQGEAADLARDAKLKIQLPSKKEIKEAKDFDNKNMKFDIPEQIHNIGKGYGAKPASGALRLLRAVAAFHPKPITKAQAAMIAGMSYKSGSCTTYIATLKREGWIEGSSNELEITQSGLEEAGDIEPISKENVVEFWINKMGNSGAGRMLKHLAEIYPQECSRDDLGMEAGVSPTSGSFTTYIATLKRNGLIERTRDGFRATRELFLEE